MAELECPIDFVTINENKARFVALLVFVLSVTFLVVSSWFIPLFLTIDFYLRGFNGGKYSMLFWAGGMAEKKIPLPNKPTDRGPKRFAAQIGFFMSLLVFGFSIIGLHLEAFIVAGILVLFSFLESFFGFCAGCHVYTYIGKYLPKRKT
jgi:hypothetical protein